MHTSTSQVANNPSVRVPILGIFLPRYNKAHIAKLHELACVVTGSRCDEVHHPKGLGWGCGMGQKAPDETAIPLCRRVHDEYHRIGVKSWEAKYGTHEIHLAKTRKLLGLPPL
jgi:Putative HNHc nuclease